MHILFAGFCPDDGDDLKENFKCKIADLVEVYLLTIWLKLEERKKTIPTCTYFHAYGTGEMITRHSRTR